MVSRDDSLLQNRLYMETPVPKAAYTNNLYQLSVGWYIINNLFTV